MSVRHAPSVSLALKLLSGLVGLPLPSLNRTAREAGKAVTHLLKRLPNINHPIAQVGTGHPIWPSLAAPTVPLSLLLLLGTP